MVTLVLTSTSFCGLFTCLVSFERRTARPKCIYDILKNYSFWLLKLDFVCSPRVSVDSLWEIMLSPTVQTHAH